MDESILKALMKLFAIIANVNQDGVSFRARNIVEAYLNSQLNKEHVEEYLKLFDEFLAFHHRNIKDSDSRVGRKRNSVNSVKVLMICQQINETLQQKEKIIVLIRLMEFISEESVITEKEIDFIKTVADTFKISETEYFDLEGFVLEHYDDIVDREKILIIQNPKEELIADNIPVQNDVFSFKYIDNEGITGKILFIHIPSTNTFVFKYVGKENLLLNGQHLVPRRAYVFTHGAVLRGPKLQPIYYSDIAGKFFAEDDKTKVVLTAEAVEFKFKNSENGLQAFSVSEESGQLIGIMGGSGVGKSTLLNILNGNLTPSSGRVLINNYDVHLEKEKLEGVVGFVPQDDLLIEELNVFQNLYFNAKLCFKDFSEKQIIKAVAKVLIDLDLDEIKHLTVGNPLNKFISGGQRKRLNIALELIREPSVLFVDEPTSGLSSMDSEMVMLLLKSQAIKGKLVIVNIHQPSSDIFKLFDKLLILDKGGRSIYYGNPIESVVYFKTAANHVNAEESECSLCGNVNPEQVLQIVEERVVNQYGKFTRNRRVLPQQWHSLYKDKIESHFKKKESSEKLPPNFFKIPNKLKQFKIFALRNLLSKLTNRQYLMINFLEAPLLAIIIGFFTKYIAGTMDDPNAYVFSENENIPAYLFMSVIVSLFIGLTVSAEEIIRDQRILQREQFLHLSRSSYLNSKIVVLFAISAIQMFSFVFIGNYILDIKGMDWDYWVILFATSCFANMLGLNISAALNSVVAIYILIPLILVPQLLFSGVIVSFEKLHKNITSPKYVPLIGNMMTSRWAYEALTVVQFRNNAFEKHFFEYDQQMSEYSFKSSFLIPDLETKLIDIEKDFKDPKAKAHVEKKLLILRNEIELFQSDVKKKKASFNLNDLQIAKINTATLEQVKKYFAELRSYYSIKHQRISDKKDQKFNDLVEDLGSRDAVYKLKDNYHNKGLADLVTNQKQLEKIIELPDRMWQRKDPIFKFPESKFGRAHLYAPVKRIGSTYIDTFYFNLLVIWLTTLLLYIALRRDWLKKLLTKFNFSMARKTSKADMRRKKRLKKFKKKQKMTKTLIPQEPETN